MTMWPNCRSQPPLALAVSRKGRGFAKAPFGGGSAFFLRPHYTHIFMKRIFILLLASSLVTLYSSAEDLKQKHRWFVPMTMTPQVEALGLTNTITKPIGLISSNGIAIYFIASQQISHKLVVRAFNAGGVEIGRAEKLLKMQQDAGYYTEFSFDSQMDIWSVRACEVGL